MATTKENLKEAFAGESQANQKYRAFAKRADQDGFPNIARLFRTTAEAPWSRIKCHEVPEEPLFFAFCPGILSL